MKAGTRRLRKKTPGARTQAERKAIKVGGSYRRAEKRIDEGKSTIQRRHPGHKASKARKR